MKFSSYEKLLITEILVLGLISQILHNDICILQYTLSNELGLVPLNMLKISVRLLGLLHPLFSLLDHICVLLVRLL